MAIDYTYKSLSVPGGGFVTGFLFHPTVPDILYCRTDIGGVYRYDFKDKKWNSLVDGVKGTEVWKTYPLAIAVDKNFPERLYMSVGLKPDSAIGYSEDYGKTFTYFETPFSDKTGEKVEIHGNATGRSTGERLLVDPFNSDILYLGTMADGLFVTTDRCQSWKRLMVGSFDEKNIAFISVDERAGSVNGHAKRMIVATSGQWGSTDGNTRGKSIYISEDGGQCFLPLEGQPKPIMGGPQDHPGYVGQQIAYDHRYMYITYSAYNIGWSNWNSVGCDTGKCYDGAVYRYQFNPEGQLIDAVDLTPPHPMDPEFKDELAPNRRLGYGLSGICTDPKIPGAVILTTITASPDVFYRSMDYGKTFQPIMAGLEIGHIDFNTSFQQPKYNGNHSLIHWMADIKINPFDSDMALFNTGAGIFATFNLTAMEKGETVIFETLNEGVEETVHLNVYAPPKGDVAVIDVIGDYGMFLFRDINEVPENTVADENNNRWITAMNADFADHSGNVLVATMRGNWTGTTKGGLVLSKDNGITFEKLPDPESINEEIDGAVAYLKTPNVTSGWVALSADEKHLVWSIGLPLDGDLVVYSHDYGQKYGKTNFYDFEGSAIVFKGKPVKIFADRIKAYQFFGFCDQETGPAFFVSHDFGEKFHQIEGPIGFPDQLLAGIDSEQDIEIRGIPGKTGAFYMALLQDGLWQITYDWDKKCFSGSCVSQLGDVIKRIGIGMGNSGHLDALYTSGTISGAYGFYSSNDGGCNWIRINDDDHHFGDIRSIDGDKKVPGRFFIATGTRGLVVGESV